MRDAVVLRHCAKALALGYILEARPDGRPEQARHVVGRQYARLFPGIVRASDLVGKTGAPTADAEKKAQG